MTNWKKVKEEQDQKRYTVPPEWDPVELVAEQLQVRVDQVSDVLRPGLRDGSVLSQYFSVWDASIGGVRRKLFYKDNSKPDEVRPEIFDPQAYPQDPQPDTGYVMNDILRAYGDRVGHRVYSRWRGVEGTFQGDGSVLWDGGKVSFPKVSAFKKCDVKFIN